MKHLTKNITLMAVVCFFLLSSMYLFAQEWSAAQKDIWKNVEAYWALMAQGDLEGFMAYVHTDYRGWSYEDPLPSDKAAVRKWMEHSFKTTEMILYEIKPVGIQTHGDFAVVHYYYTTLFKDAEGKEKSRAGRWTDILIKQGDKWLLIGDHGGQASKD